MSSAGNEIGRAGAWLMVGISIIALAWYAHNQLLYSLYFFYQVASFLFPGLLPPVR